MSIPVEVTLALSQKPQDTYEHVSEKPGVFFRKRIIFSCVPRKGDRILNYPGFSLPGAEIGMVTWKYCKGGLDPDEWCPFILARLDDSGFSVEAFVLLFKQGWKVADYESRFQNRLISAAEQAGLGSAVPMWKSPIK